MRRARRVLPLLSGEGRGEGTSRGFRFDLLSARLRDPCDVRVATEPFDRLLKWNVNSVGASRDSRPPQIDQALPNAPRAAHLAIAALSLCDKKACQLFRPMRRACRMRRIRSPDYEFLANAPHAARMPMVAER